jgi:hypothetical protein
MQCQLTPLPISFLEPRKCITNNSFRLFVSCSSHHDQRLLASKPTEKVSGMGKRPARDPGAPKRNMGAYLVHQNAMREQFKALNPGVTFAQLAKDTLAMYSELPPSDKEAWVARAEADKALKTFMNLPRTYLPLVMTQKETRSLEVREAAKENTRRTQRLRSEICRLICSIRTLCVSSFKRENPGMVSLTTDCLW